MFTVVLPSAVAPATQYAGRAPQFAPGQIVEAVVLALLKDGAVRIAIGDLALDVKSEVPLQPGSTLRLAVKGTEHAIRLVPIPGSVRSPVAGAADPSSRDALRSTAVSSGEQRPAPTGTLASPAMQAASIHPPLDHRAQPIVRIDVAQPASAGAPASLAVPNGGSIARTAAPMSAALSEWLTSQATSAPAQVVPNSVESGRSPLQTALAASIRAAAAKQSGLAPLFANVEALLAQSASWPEPLRQAALDLLRLRVPADSPITSKDIRSAVARAGLFLEAQLAVAHGSAAPAPDLKRVLLVLRQALQSWLGAQMDLSHLPAAVAHRAPDAAATARQPERPSLGVPPPYRGAPTTAQPVVAATIADWPAPKAAEHLLVLTEGALARQTLLQAASIPERSETQSEPAAPRWVLEIPIVAAQGTSIAQCEIGRDGRPQDGGDQVPLWRARFSVDVEPIGPVHVQIALLGQRAAVTLWAERTDTAGEMRARTALLTDALQRVELESDIHIRTGAPRAPQSAQPAGRFLDQAS